MKFMKKLLLTCFCALATFVSFAQTAKSAVVLRDGSVIKGELLEVLVNNVVKMKIAGGSEITIQYKEVAAIYPDASYADTAAPATNIATSNPSPPAEKKIAPASEWHFQSHNELALGLGVGPVGASKDPFTGKALSNGDSFFGIYTANGLGYKNLFFAGIGIGFSGHAEGASYNIPFLLDFRCRVLPDKKFSPIVMAATGVSYFEGSVGTFDVCDGVGLSIMVNSRLNAHLIFTHTYQRFQGALRAEGAAGLDNLYFNYVGGRLGVSFKL
jgi:hypothetical protein